MRNIFLFSLLSLAFFALGSFAFVNPADQCTSIGVTDDTCIMCSGTPCMMNTDPDICPGTVNPDEPDWGPLAWIGGSSPCICYCPYSLKLAYDAAHKTNLCANIYCYDKCEYSTEYRSGSCNPDTGQCIYGTANHCDNGCNGDFCADAPEPAQDNCANVNCYDKCENSQEYISGTCNPNTGKCEYGTTNYCDNGCNGNSCAAATEPTDNCANVQCDPKCEGTMLKTDGYCDSDTGNCIYSETDCGDIGCNASSLTCNEATGETFAGRIYYTEYNRPNGGISEQGIQVPLRNIYVWFEYKDPEGKMHSDKDKFVVFTDSDGKFTFNAPPEFMDPGNKIDVIIVFSDKNSKLFISTDQLNAAGKGSVVDYTIKDGVPPSDPSLKNLDFDFKDAGAGYSFVAQAYSNVMKAVSFKENVLSATSTLQEKVTVFHSDSEGTFHRTEYSSSALKGMFIAASDSKYYLPEGPVNREYHEYCHHIQMEALKQERNTMPLPGGDHNGYPSNAGSGWGYLEGWAEFCAMQMVKNIGGIQDVKYVTGNSLYNLEADYRIRDGTDEDEEFAIAGIMHDLADSPSDYSYGQDDDSVSLPLSTIWSAVSKSRDFGDGKGERHAQNLHDFYVAISDEVDSASLQPGIDAIFISHGAYQDENRNGQWDKGEQIGYSGQGSAASDIRSDVKPPEGTQVEVSGGSGLLADVTVTFDGQQSYLSYSYTAPIAGGKVYLPILPSQYGGTVSLRAANGATGASSQNSFSISNSDFRKRLDPSKPIGSYSPGIQATSSQCSSDGQCIAWNQGDSCNSGSCSFSQAIQSDISGISGVVEAAGGNGTAGTSNGSGAACCGGPAAMAFVVSIALLRGRKKD